MSSSACWMPGREAHCSSSKPYCSARPTIADRLRLNSSVATFRSSSSVASSFSMLPTSRTFCLCCASSRIPRDQIAGFRLLQIIPGVGPASAELVLNGMAAAPDPFLALAEYPSPPRASEDWPAFVTTILDLAAREIWMAIGISTRTALVRTACRPNLRGCDFSTCRPYSARSDCGYLSITRALFDRTHSGSAGRKQRSRRNSIAR